jgi:hypothetical protein
MIKTVSIPLPKQERVSAKISVSADFRPGRAQGIILAHGAGNDTGLTIQAVYRTILDETVEILKTGFFDKAGQA